MAQNYTRQSTLSDGDTITASLFNDEYNQLVNAFAYSSTSASSTGHRHDGSAGQGGNIFKIGDLDFLNKIEVDSTNNRWGFYVEVSSAAVEQIRIQDGSIVPVTTNDIDLGTSSLQFKDLYIDGTANVDSLTLTSGATVTTILDEDDLSSDSATALVTQQSVKAYIDAQVTAQDLDFQADTGGALSIDLDSETMTFTGGTGIDTSGSGNAVTFAIDSTVATLTGTQTLTNKTLTSPDVNTPDIDGGTIDGTVIGGTTAAAGSFTTVSATGNITVGGTVDGRDVATDGTKLDGIEAGATADQTAAEIRTLVESATDSNVFTDADHTKLDGIEANATADQTAAEIRTLVDSATDSNVFTDADHTKLDGIEAGADVTDTANVTAAGAVMDSELTNETAVKALNQGVATTDSPTFAGVTVNGTVEFDGLSGTGAVSVTDILDQDDMSSNSATALATQQSIKAYVDSQVATVDTLAEVLGNGNTTGGTDIAVGTGDDITFADNSKAIFGAGSDLQIYHDGSNSYIDEAGTGDLVVLSSTRVRFEGKTTGDTYMRLNENSSVQLYHDNTVRLTTTSSGIDVTGVITTDGMTTSADINFGDNDKAVFGAGSDLQIYHDGNHSYVTDAGTGNLNIQSNGVGVVIAHTDGTDLAVFNSGNGAVSLYNSGNLKLATTGTGIDVTGNTLSDSLTANGSLSGLNAGSVMLDYNGSSVSRLLAVGADATTTGVLKIVSTASDGGPYIEALTINSTGIDVTGTVTADGLTVAKGSNGTYATLSGDDAGGGRGLAFTSSSVSGSVGAKHTLNALSALGEVALQTNSKNRINIGSGGDISFYEDTGTTAKLFWDASAESLGIGTSSPSSPLEIAGGSAYPTTKLSRDGGSAATQGYLTTGFSAIGYSGGTGADSYLVSEHGFGFAVNAGTNALVITDGGNVGIGTSSPDSALMVTDGSNYSMRIGYLGTSQNYIDVDTHIFRSANATERMRIDSSGNVGIASSSPITSLTLGTGTTGVSFQSSSSTFNSGKIAVVKPFEVGSGNGHLVFETYEGGNGGGERMRIDSSGNVGIGTSSVISGARLDVRGANANNLSSLDAQVLTVQDTTSYAANVGGGIAFGYKFNSSGASLQRGAVIKAVKENGTDGDYSTSMAFATVANGGQTTEKMRIDSSGNVGIGTDSPTFAAGGGLQVQTDTFSSVRVTETGNTGLDIAQASDGKGYVYLRDNADLLFGTNNTERMRITSGGALEIGPTANKVIIKSQASFQNTTLESHIINANGLGAYGSGDLLIQPRCSSVSSNNIVFGTSGGTNTTTERLRIDASGNLLVGKSSSSFTTAGAEVQSTGRVEITTSAETMNLNTLATSGNLIRFFANSSLVGSIGAVNSNIYLGTGDTGLYFNASDDTVMPINVTTVAGRDNGVNLGKSDTRFKDLHLSGSINLNTASTAATITMARSTNGNNNMLKFSTGGTDDWIVGQRNDGTSDFRFYSYGTSSDAVSITRTGNLLVGTTSANIYNTTGDDGVAIKTDNIQVQRANNEPLFLNRTGSDGVIASFRKDGSEVGSIASRSGVVSSIILDPRSGGAGFTGAGVGVDNLRAITPANETGAEIDAKVALGNASHRFRKVYLSSGVQFGTTDAAAELLDDYEEGTWNVSFQGATVTPANTYGHYTKIGRVVYFSYYSGASTIASASGGGQIGGLPFTVLNDSTAYVPGSVAHNTFFGGSTTAGVEMYANAGNTNIIFTIRGTTGAASFVDGSNKSIMISGFYITS